MNASLISRLTALTVLAALLSCATIGGYAAFGHQLIGAIHAGEVAPALRRLFGGGRELAFYLAKADLIVAAWGMLLLAGCCTLLALLARLRRPVAAVTGLDWALGALYCGMGLAFLILYGYEGEWYRLDRMLAWEGTPPFQHRVLFIWLAHLLHWAFPESPILAIYLATQMVALVLALLAVRMLCALFLRRDLAFTAQFLALAMWAPTVSYYTFYDVGTIAIYAAALYCRLQARFGAYLVIATVGTYNHEVTLFLAAACLFAWFGRMPARKLATLLAAQLALYAMVRWSLFHFLPTHAAWEEGKLAMNVQMILRTPTVVLANLAPLIVWFGAALGSWSAAPAMLRRTAIILPCLLLMTFVVGQLNEARLFDAFIPVAVALLCCRIQAVTARVSAGAEVPVRDERAPLAGSDARSVQRS